MLVGIVTKNSILIVEFANRLRDEDLDLIAATGRPGPRRRRQGAPPGHGGRGRDVLLDDPDVRRRAGAYILFEWMRARLFGAARPVAVDPRAAAWIEAEGGAPALAASPSASRHGSHLSLLADETHVAFTAVKQTPEPPDVISILVVTAPPTRGPAMFASFPISFIV